MLPTPTGKRVTLLWIAAFCFAAICASGVNSFETPNPDIALALATTGPHLD